MSTIEKLSISNVRSFGPNARENIIEFYKPLTVIVGHNGAGKTTIIECLKYATSGDMPPSCSNGQAFVQDPNLAGSREITAQIRLRFRNVKGEPFSVARSMQLTQKSGHKLEFKSKEGTITLVRNKERISQSHRCADIDALIPQFMGVSKAILNNVIFCHQEDSNWPLLEKNKVKQKFDDLFCASRYNKALAEIKDQRKKLNQEVKELRLRLQDVKNRKDQADEFKDTLSRFQAELVTAQEEIDKFQKVMAEETQKVERCSRMEKEARDHIKKIESLQAEHKTLIRNHQEFEKSLTEEYLESEEELLQTQQNFDAEMRKLRTTKKNTETELTNLKSRRTALNRNAQQLSSDLRLRESEIATAQKNLAQRDKAIETFASSTGVALSNTSGSLTEEVIAAFLTSAMARLKAHTEEIEKLRKELKAHRDRLSKQSGSLSAEIASLESTIAQNKSNIRDNAKTIKSHQTEIDKNNTLLGEIDQLEAQVTKKEQELQQYQDEMKSNKYEEQIASLNTTREAKEKESRHVSSIISLINKNSALLSKVELSRAATEQKRTAWVTKLKELLERLEKCVEIDSAAILATVENDSFNPSTLTTTVDEHLKRHSQQVSQLDKKLRDQRAQFSRVNGRLTANADSLNKLRATLKKHQSALKDCNEPLPDLIAAVEKTILARQKDITMTTSAEVIYKSFIDQGTADKQCPLCERAMDASGLSELMSKLSLNLERIPQRLESKRNALKTAEAQIQAYRKLLPHWNEFERLQKEIPSLEELNASLTTENKTLEQAVAELEKQLPKHNDDLQTLKGAKEAAARIAQEFNAYKRALSETKKLEAQLPDGDFEMTLEDANERQESLQAETRKIAQKLNALQEKEKTCQSQINSCYSFINKSKSRLLAATNSAKAIETLRQKMKQLTEDNDALQLRITQDTETLQTQKQALEVLMAEEKSTVDEYTTKETAAQKQKDAFSNQFLTVRNHIKQVEDVSIPQLEAQQKDLTAKVKEATTQMEAAEAQVEKTEASLRDIGNKISSSEIAKRNLDDNITFRRQAAEIEKIAQQIAALEKSTSSPSAFVLAEKADAEKKLRAASAKFEKLSGMKKVYSAQMKKTQADLAKPTYQTVDSEFKQIMVTLSGTIMATEDLDRYYQALDKAIMQYHSMKIDEINKILKDLWQNTYRGSDIDSIEIRADSEGARSYNYRVIMIKGDSALDMRGRCSAGQKVLASLVIRLALAESLGVNCGIIALDEPTTNLDRENVQSFASALVDLIEMRSRQGTFQLIVITHDEEFVQLLGRSERAEHYWRVSKDLNQHSKLTRCDIADLS